MAKISSLIDNTSDIIYPQTRANAVLMADSSTVENAVNQRPKLVLSASEPAGTIDDNTLYGVYGDVGQITTEELADSAVTTAKIASSAITTAKIADGAISTAKIADSAITSGKLGSLAVTTAKIANGAVTGVTNTATSIGSAKLALNTVGTPNLRDGAVTSDKVDWTTLVETVGSGDNICYKFADGRMLALIKQTITNISSSEWSGIYESSLIPGPTFATPFIAQPFCTVSISQSSLECWIAHGSGANNGSAATYNLSSAHAQGVVLLRPTSMTSSNSTTLCWQAWGRWK